MNLFCISFLVLLAGRLVQPTNLEEFVASSPCDALPRKLLGIEATAGCEFVQWNLVLNRNAQTGQPGTFTLRFTSGVSQPGTQGFQDGGTPGQLTGRWTVEQLTSRRTLYRLTPNSGEPLVFLKLDDRLLHLLDADGKLMIGHAAWSYTLNRK